MDLREKRTIGSGNLRITNGFGEKTYSRRDKCIEKPLLTSAGEERGDEKLVNQEKVFKV
jgi:hypothetical protein